MRIFKQSTATNIMVFMTDSSDHITGKTGLTLSITASKDGAAFASITPTVTERGNGWYNLALTAAHTDTIGDLALHITATGADPSDLINRVMSEVSEVSAIKAKTDNLPSGLQKNTALSNFMFLMTDSADHITPKTGLTITAQRSIDGAAFAACANSATEVGNGMYKINLAAADLNGDVITLRFTATGADARLITIVTEP